MEELKPKPSPILLPRSPKAKAYSVPREGKKTSSSTVKSIDSKDGMFNCFSDVE